MCDKLSVQFLLDTVRDFHFTLLNSILLISVMSSSFRFQGNASIAVCWNASSNVGSIFNRCQCCWSMFFMFGGVLLKVFDNVRHNVFLLLFHKKKSWFGFQSDVFHTQVLQIDLLIKLIWASNSEFVEQILLTRSDWLWSILFYKDLGCSEFACK